VFLAEICSSREETTVGAGVAVGSGGEACLAPVLAVGEASLPTSLPHHPRPYGHNFSFLYERMSKKPVAI